MEGKEKKKQNKIKITPTEYIFFLRAADQLSTTGFDRFERHWRIAAYFYTRITRVYYYTRYDIRIRARDRTYSAVSFGTRVVTKTDAITTCAYCIYSV